MPEKVICNTSPLFYLHRLNNLVLLQKLYNEITVPQAVLEEIETGRRQGEDVPNIQGFDWIKIDRVEASRLLGLINDFGKGEAQVLALAIEQPGSLVIVDDLLAREVAQLRGIRLTGTAGILLKAKQQGYLSEIRPLLDRLIDLRFRLRDEVKNHILKLANE